MKVRFWGVRGSIPVPGPKTVKYGGNTSCIEIRGDKNELLVLDAGTGLRELGNFLIANDLKKGPLKINILLSHTHWDHIQGFPLFGPSFIPSTDITFRGPVNFSGALSEIVAGQMNYSYFPIKLDELKAKINFVELQEDTFEVGPFKITTKYLNHPILTLGYRVQYGKKVLVSLYDTEPYRNLFINEDIIDEDELDEVDREAMEEAESYVKEMNDKLIRFISGADLCIYDAQYKEEEYEAKKGWGHSTVDQAIKNSIKSKVKKLALFHHDPLREDEQVTQIQRYAQSLVKEKNSDMVVFCARERLEIDF